MEMVKLVSGTPLSDLDEAKLRAEARHMAAAMQFAISSLGELVNDLETLGVPYMSGHERTEWRKWYVTGKGHGLVWAANAAGHLHNALYAFAVRGPGHDGH